MVGIINKNHEKLVFSYGSKSISTNEKPDENTVFDIGSITKSFTSIIATNMYLQGIIQEENIEYYLPVDEITMPTKDNIEITFEHLLTHTSGLPRTPHENGSLFPLPEGYVLENPYAAYTTEQVYDYLSNYCTLLFTPGTFWSYSNTGVGLVGHAIGLIDGTSYETVLKREIFDVLGMTNSSLFLTQEQISNQAFGHNAVKAEVPFFTANDIFQGCGMIKSSLTDMFKFLEANMELTNSPLNNAMNYTHQKASDIFTGSLGYTGLCWFITNLDDGQTITYNGGDTNGHSAFIGFNKTESFGVIILMNCSMHDGTNINMGKKIMQAINEY